jgi:hypothetical protein
MNCKVMELCFWFSLIWDNHFGTPVRSHDCDVPMGINPRWQAANQQRVAAFVSVHHNGGPVNPSGWLLYCNSQTLDGDIWISSSDLAGQVASFMSNDDCADDPSVGSGIAHELACCASDDDYNHVDHDRMDHAGVLFYNRRPAILSEPFYVQQPTATALCNQDFFPEPGGDCNHVAARELNGFLPAIMDTFDPPVVNDFAAVAGAASVTISWTESDPRNVAYELLRADSCWGPYETIAWVEGNSGTAMYTYVDDSVVYGQTYVYHLRVVGDVYQADCSAPSGLPGPPNLGQPGNIQVTRLGWQSIQLTWPPVAGNPDGYHVFRARYFPMETCNSAFEYVGSTTTPTFSDTEASESTYSYRIRAFRQGAGGPISDEAIVATPTDTDELASVVLGALAIDAISPSRSPIVLFTLPTSEDITLVVYDVRGRVVNVLQAGLAAAGDHLARWNGLDESGQRAAAGVYMIRLFASTSGSVTQKVILLAR